MHPGGLRFFATWVTGWDGLVNNPRRLLALKKALFGHLYINVIYFGDIYSFLITYIRITYSDKPCLLT